MAELYTTHSVEIEETVVVKRFRAWDRDEHVREWRALNLLAKHAPGLAPEPVKADLDGDPPTIWMSRLPGEPMGGRPLLPLEIDAVAAAIDTLHRAVPAETLATIASTAWQPATARAYLHGMASQLKPAERDPLAVEALAAGAGWLDSDWLDRAAAEDATMVFGQCDGNLANYLWDGTRVRLVDFEDSGRSDRMFELADFVEHLTVWNFGQIDAEAFLARLDLTAAERARVHGFRRVFALFWLQMLVPGGRSHHRNPPETHLHQARRLLELVG
jgi:hypothetical protein